LRSFSRWNRILGISSAGFVVVVEAMPTGTFGDVTADANTAIFLIEWSVWRIPYQVRR